MHWLILTILFSCCVSSVAQSAIEPGAFFEADVNKTVSAAHAKRGDLVEARLVEAIKDPAGKTIVPRNATVIGHVVEASARNNGAKETLLSVALDRIVWKTGQLSLKMAITQMAQPGYDVSLPGAAGVSRMASSSFPGSSTAAGRAVAGETVLRSDGKNVWLQKGIRLSITVLK